MIGRYALAFGLALSVCLGSISSDAQAQPEYVWDMPNVFSRTSSDGVADQLFTRLVQEKTEGRISIVNHFDGSLGYGGADHLDAVRDGAVPIARHATPFFGGYDPLFLLSSLPFLMQSQSDVETFNRITYPHFEELFLQHNQVLIAVGLFPPSGIWSREPVDSVQKLQGLKIRTFDLNSTQTFAEAGAAAVNLTWSDVVPALSTRAIDAVLTSADLGVTTSLYEYLPVFTEINWTIPFSAVTVNKDAWDSLPDELRQALLEAGRETTERTIARLATQVEENYADMRQKDLTVIEDAPAEILEHIQRAAEKTIEAWRERAGPSAAVLDEYLEAVGR